MADHYIKGENLTKGIPPGQTKLAYTRRSSTFSLGDSNIQILKVLRYTATQVVCESGTGEIRFNLDDGSERGGNYGSKAEVVSERILDGMLRNKLEGELRGLGYKLEELARKMAHANRDRMSTAAIKNRIELTKAAITGVESMIACGEHEERK
jgi:hypothetical protein